jgi:hypothetical protein
MHDGGCFAARERVVDRLTVAARAHEVLSPQHGEVLRERRLAQADQRLQLAD